MKSMLVPDTKALVWLAIGLFVLPKVLSKVGVSIPGTGA